LERRTITSYNQVVKLSLIARALKPQNDEIDQNSPDFLLLSTTNSDRNRVT
jgi:hypothetical protein